MLFGQNGPEHEAHLFSSRVAIRFSWRLADATATAPLTLDAMTHRVP
jgi:hypothetical protein